MMNFEDAAQRLARDQSKIRGRRSVAVSEKAKRQAEYQRKQREELQKERERKRKLEEDQKRYMTSCLRSLNVKSLGSVSGGDGSYTTLQLQPTSIHGEGDKISLPPSVLQTLTSDMQDVGSPWTFRIGLLNPYYQFPASPLIQTLKPTDDDWGSTTDMAVDSDDDDEDYKAFLDELAHKYLAYTHCTVVEFTQEEGNVGIPRHIAAALLHSNDTSTTIPSSRTVDPAKQTSSETEMDTTSSELDQNATPGHVAWGAFDIPDMPLEVTLLKLPKGTGCTLVPTREAVEHGFYGLKDVKLVLEQSLIRTRATLSVGDFVSTWHRGIQFELQVTEVSPASFGAVTCINTDIEVIIGESKTEAPEPTAEATSEEGHRLGAGQVLGAASDTTTSNTNGSPSAHQPQHVPTTSPVELLPEPLPEQTENVVTVQIRSSSGQGKRRFDVNKATIKDLMEFAASLIGQGLKFQLVTRFPRRVLTMEAAPSTLSEAGIQSGQELFLVEMV